MREDERDRATVGRHGRTRDHSVLHGQREFDAGRCRGGWATPGHPCRRQSRGSRHDRERCQDISVRERVRTGESGGVTAGDGFKGDEHVPGVLPSGIRIVVQAAVDNPANVPWDVRGQTGGSGGGVSRRPFVAGRVAIQLGEHEPEREDIGPEIGGSARQLLRRHVAQRAEDGALGGQRLCERSRVSIDRDRLLASPGQTEVEQHGPVVRQDDVARLQIAMDDARAVCRCQRLGNLPPVPKRIARRQFATRQTRRERVSFEVLHHQEVGPVLVTDVEQLADVGMRQARDRARLAFETLSGGGVGWSGPA